MDGGSVQLWGSIDTHGILETTLFFINYSKLTLLQIKIDLYQILI